MVSRALRRVLGGGRVWLVLTALLATSCGRRAPYEGKSVAQLEAMLKSSSPTEQVQGAIGLSEKGAKASPAVPTLIERLRSPHGLVRQNAAYALGKIGPEARGAVAELIGALGDKDWRMRRQAAMALGEIGPDARAAVADLQKLERDLPIVGTAAREALARIVPKKER